MPVSGPTSAMAIVFLGLPTFVGPGARSRPVSVLAFFGLGLRRDRPAVASVCDGADGPLSLVVLAVIVVELVSLIAAAVFVLIAPVIALIPVVVLVHLVVPALVFVVAVHLGGLGVFGFGLLLVLVSWGTLSLLWQWTTTSAP